MPPARQVPILKRTRRRSIVENVTLTRTLTYTGTYYVTIFAIDHFRTSSTTFAAPPRYVPQSPAVGGSSTNPDEALHEPVRKGKAG